MKKTLFVCFILSSIFSYSQTVHTRPLSRNPVKWNSKKEKYDKDSSNVKFNTLNPKIILSYDEIKIIDGDTTTIYLNETPEKIEDSSSVDLRWYESTDNNGRETTVFLYFYKKYNDYEMWILYDEGEVGLFYIMKPLKVDVIPFKNENIN